MATLQIQTAGTGVVRDAHYVTPTGASTPVRTLLLEPQRTNLCIRSEEFADVSWGKGAATVTANASTAPDGTATASLFIVSGSTAGQIFRGVTFTGDGEKCVAVYLKAGTSTLTRVAIFDATTSTHRHQVSVSWAAGVPTLSTFLGAGTTYPVEALGNGWYRILFSATGVVAANDNRTLIFPDRDIGTGTVLAWGAQVENAVVPSSYIPTEATTVTRNADSLYWDIPALVPREMTVYVRHVNVGLGVPGTGVTQTIVNIGDSAFASVPRLRLFTQATTPRVGINYNDGTNNREVASADVTGMPTLGAVVEVRGVLNSLGGVIIHGSADGNAEASSGTSAASTLPAAFAQPRLYLAGTNVGETPKAITHVAIALGTKTRAEMRAIAGVP